MNCVYFLALSTAWYPAILNSIEDFALVASVVHSNGMSICGTERIGVDGSTNADAGTTFLYDQYISDSSGMLHE